MAARDVRPALVAVLAGGRGRRLGGAKPVAELGGKPLISYPLAAAADLDAIVVAKAGTPLPPLEVEVVREPDLPRHPLAGVVAALDAAQGRAVVVLGCDMPFVEEALVAHLATLEAHAAVVEAAGRLHPLLGRYAPSVRGALADALAAGASATAAVERLDPVVLGERQLARFGDPARICFNVNSPADLELADRWLARP